MNQTNEPASSSVVVQAQILRIRTLIIVLAIMNIPFLIFASLDLRRSVVGVVASLVTFGLLGLYYYALRRGYGIGATYVGSVVLAVLVVIGAHNSSGGLTATGSLFVLLMVGVSLVLSEVRAIDFMFGLCLCTYVALIGYELAIAPPETYQDLYQGADIVELLSPAATLIVVLVGVWLVCRYTLANLRQATNALERARAEAEARANENALLATYLQTSNDALQTTQAQLRATVDDLTLPFIPVQQRVLLLPLVGYLDRERADTLISGLLHSVHEQRAEHVILDITGLRNVDASVAATLVQATHAVQLLGADVTISGMNATAAQALVALSLGGEQLKTVGRLADALRG